MRPKRNTAPADAPWCGQDEDSDDSGSDDSGWDESDDDDDAGAASNGGSAARKKAAASRPVYNKSNPRPIGLSMQERSELPQLGSSVCASSKRTYASFEKCWFLARRMRWHCDRLAAGGGGAHAPAAPGVARPPPASTWLPQIATAAAGALASEWPRPGSCAPRGRP